MEHVLPCVGCVFYRYVVRMCLKQPDYHVVSTLVGKAIFLGMCGRMIGKDLDHHLCAQTEPINEHGGKVQWHSVKLLVHDLHEKLVQRRI